ncbi:hypothetical protein [Gimesia panareensis]|uniref:hypothetical protein n=1 Tax=Gimesia panareensis TaxID=2527978 RepID=UPI001E4B85B7|nr:hypothetical protein [Gimesia panareensis]
MQEIAGCIISRESCQADITTASRLNCGIISFNSNKVTRRRSSTICQQSNAPIHGCQAAAAIEQHIPTGGQSDRPVGRTDTAVHGNGLGGHAQVTGSHHCRVGLESDIVITAAGNRQVAGIETVQSFHVDSIAATATSRLNYDSPCSHIGYCSAQCRIDQRHTIAC